MVFVIIFEVADGDEANITFVVARIYVCTLGENLTTNVAFVIEGSFICALGEGFTANVALVVLVLVDVSESGTFNIHATNGTSCGSGAGCRVVGNVLAFDTGVELDGVDHCSASAGNGRDSNLLRGGSIYFDFVVFSIVRA